PRFGIEDVAQAQGLGVVLPLEGLLQIALQLVTAMVHDLLAQRRQFLSSRLAVDLVEHHAQGLAERVPATGAPQQTGATRIVPCPPATGTTQEHGTILPSSSRIRRDAASARRVSWVATRKACPNREARSESSSISLAALWGSRLPVGSSVSTRAGRLAKARAS